VIICNLYRVDNVSRYGSGYSTDVKDEITCTKIFYASRTHSQLAQVLPEMSKLKFPGRDVSVKSYQLPLKYSLPQKRRPGDDLDYEGSLDSATPVRVTRTVSLGSRKQLCINDELRQKARDLDEACRELLGGQRQSITLIDLGTKYNVMCRKGGEAVSIPSTYRRR
jgi:chromosome transmission fidelity protein 1